MHKIEWNSKYEIIYTGNGNPNSIHQMITLIIQKQNQNQIIQ